MAKKSKGNRTPSLDYPISVRLQVELHEFVKRQAREDGETVSTVVRRMVTESAKQRGFTFTAG